MTQAQPTLFPIPLVEDTPHNRRMLRRILGQYRHYFGQGTAHDPEAAAWAMDQHYRIIGESKVTRSRKVKSAS